MCKTFAIYYDGEPYTRPSVGYRNKQRKYFFSNISRAKGCLNVIKSEVKSISKSGEGLLTNLSFNEDDRQKEIEIYRNIDTTKLYIVEFGVVKEYKDE